MQNNKLFNAMQMATGLALLIGLIMVFIELRQAKSLSLAELTSVGYSELMADMRTVMGENSAAVIAKSCMEPEKLEATEMVILDAYYNSKMAQVSRLRVLELVADYGVPWRSVAAQQIYSVVATKPGQAWFERHLRADPELYAMGMKIIETGVDCSSSLATTSIFDEDAFDADD